MSRGEGANRIDEVFEHVMEHDQIVTPLDRRQFTTHETQPGQVALGRKIGIDAGQIRKAISSQSPK